MYIEEHRRHPKNCQLRYNTVFVQISFYVFYKLSTSEGQSYNSGLIRARICISKRNLENLDNEK